MTRWALIASLALVCGCATAPDAPVSGKSSVWGVVRLAPHEGAEIPRGGSGYGDPSMVGVQMVDYSRPGFAVVTVGQTILMPNDDSIYHNVFSFSKPNDFDLGVYPAEQMRSIKFEHPGVVELYCSIHESMNGTVYVAPSPHFALVPESGAFELRGVPPGRYRLGTWSEMLPDTSQTLRVAPGQSATAHIQIGQTDP